MCVVAVTIGASDLPTSVLRNHCNFGIGVNVELHLRDTAQGLLGFVVCAPTAPRNASCDTSLGPE